MSKTDWYMCTFDMKVIPEKLTTRTAVITTMKIWTTELCMNEKKSLTFIVCIRYLVIT